MLKLPHPLFADHVDFDRVLRRFVLREIKFRPPHKERDRNQQRNHRPQRFQFVRAFDWPRNFKRIAAAITNDEEDNDDGNQQREENRHAPNEKLQIKSNPTIKIIVSTPATRMTFIITTPYFPVDGS